jgi:hypothetical protein
MRKIYRITGIGQNAFKNVSDLTGNLTIPNTVILIGAQAFYGCNGLNGNLTIGENVKSIGESAFKYCDSLENLTIGENVESIENYAFQYCARLENLTIGENVTSIGIDAFYGCEGLINKDIVDYNQPGKIFRDLNNVFYIKSNQGSYYCLGKSSNVTEDDFPMPANELIIKDNTKVIANYAFVYCNQLDGNLSIPDSVISIGASAFVVCSFTGNLTIGENVKSIGDNAFA